MPSVKDVVKGHTELDDDDLAWLQLLVADWQIIANLSFADLVLWLPDREGHGYRSRWSSPSCSRTPLSTPSVTRAVISTYGCSDWQDGSKS